MKAQSRNVSFAILLSVLLLTCSCSIDKADQALKTDDTAQSKSAKSNDANASFDDLTRSKFCADAAEAFWKRNRWKDEKDPLDQSSYTSHYNKSMNKCLVNVNEFNLEIEKGKVYEQDSVFDALENKSVAARWQVKKNGDSDTEPERYILFKDGRRVGTDDVPSFLPWFQSLMTN